MPTLADRLFFILHYLKTNNLQSIQSALFGINQPKANVWIHCLQPLLSQALAALGELPAHQMTEMTLAEDEEALYFHDGTERLIPRPADPEQQRHYSGKKKRHGAENNVLIDRMCKIRFLGNTVEGKKHDKKTG